jgi:5,10-methylenetetrahydromethanopterin reductase
VTVRVPELGVALPVHGPVEALVAGARDAEELGYRYLWATDDRLQKDVFGVLAAIALGTEKLRLGPGVTNPYSRHPALIATGIATLDELSGGRAVLGLGAGGTNHRALGIRREAPLAALSEAIELIRGLLEGRELTLEGRVVRAQDARLDFDPLRSSIPIYVGSRGPRMLELAGAQADGVIVGNVASPDGWRYALERIAAGAARARRELEAIRLTAWVYCSVGDDTESALDAIRPMVATSLATSRAVLPALGLELPPEYVREMEARGWSLERAAVTAAGRAIPEATLRWFGLAGTPVECAASLRELLSTFPQISQVAIVPAAPRGQSAAEVVRRFSREVVPRVSTRPVPAAAESARR